MAATLRETMRRLLLEGAAITSSPALDTCPCITGRADDCDDDGRAIDCERCDGSGAVLAPIHRSGGTWTQSKGLAACSTCLAMRALNDEDDCASCWALLLDAAADLDGIDHRVRAAAGA